MDSRWQLKCREPPPDLGPVRQGALKAFRMDLRPGAACLRVVTGCRSDRPNLFLMCRIPVEDRGDCLLMGRRAVEAAWALPFRAADGPMAVHRIVLADFGEPGFANALHGILERMDRIACAPFFLMMDTSGSEPSVLAQARTWRHLMGSSGWVVLEISGEASCSGGLIPLLQAWRTVLRASRLGHMDGLMAHLKASHALRCSIAAMPQGLGLRQEICDRLAAGAFEGLRRRGAGLPGKVSGVFTFDWAWFTAAHLEKLLEGAWKPCGRQVEWGPMWFADSGQPEITLLLLGHG